MSRVENGACFSKFKDFSSWCRRRIGGLVQRKRWRNLSAGIRETANSNKTLKSLTESSLKLSKKLWVKHRKRISWMTCSLATFQAFSSAITAITILICRTGSWIWAYMLKVKRVSLNLSNITSKMISLSRYLANHAMNNTGWLKARNCLNVHPCFRWV